MANSAYIVCEDTFENALNALSVILATDAPSYTIAIQKQHSYSFVDSKIIGDSNVYIFNPNFKVGKEKYLDKGNIMVFDNIESSYQWKRLQYIKTDMSISEIMYGVKNSPLINKIKEFLKTGVYTKIIMDIYLVYMSTETNRIQNMLNILTYKGSDKENLIEDSKLEGREGVFKSYRRIKKFALNHNGVFLAIEGTIKNLMDASIFRQQYKADVCFIIDVDLKMVYTVGDSNKALSISNALLNNTINKCLLCSNFTVKFLEFSKHFKEI